MQVYLENEGKEQGTEIDETDILLELFADAGKKNERLSVSLVPEGKEWQPLRKQEHQHQPAHNPMPVPVQEMVTAPAANPASCMCLSNRKSES